MPRLSPLHWLVLVVFLGFYGFAVFALTRDYYVRHPVRPAPATAERTPPGHPALPGGTLAAADAIPDSVTESNPDLLRTRADALFRTDRFREAIPVYRRILELDPQDIDTQNDLGLALFYTGDTAGALEAVRKGPAADPGFQRGWLTLGFVTLQSGDLVKAREALERARDLGPDNPVGKEAARLLGTEAAGSESDEGK